MKKSLDSLIVHGEICKYTSLELIGHSTSETLSVSSCFIYLFEPMQGDFYNSNELSIMFCATRNITRPQNYKTEASEITLNDW